MVDVNKKMKIRKKQLFLGVFNQICRVDAISKNIEYAGRRHIPTKINHVKVLRSKKASFCKDATMPSNEGMKDMIYKPPPTTVSSRYSN